MSHHEARVSQSGYYENGTGLLKHESTVVMVMMNIRAFFAIVYVFVWPEECECQSLLDNIQECEPPVEIDSLYVPLGNHCVRRTI